MSVYMIRTITPLPLNFRIPNKIPSGIPMRVDITTEENETYRDRPTISNISASPAHMSRNASTNPCPIVSMFIGKLFIQRQRLHLERTAPARIPLHRIHR